MFTRRSVRKYGQAPLSSADLGKVAARLDGLKSLEGCSAAFDIMSANEVSDNRAPHYIVGFCKPEPLQYINMGYMLQEMDLYLQAMGLGTLWLGGPNHKPKRNAVDYCIMLAFGLADASKPARMDEKDFSRIKLSDISDKDCLTARAVRVAPSAMNSQPWKLSFGADFVDVAYKGRGLLKLALRKRLSKIDIGIAAKHAELGLEKEGKIIEKIHPYADGKNFGVRIDLTMLLSPAT